MTPPPPPPAAATHERWAVVIGVGAYESAGIPRLKYTVSDAEAIHQTLIGPAGFKKENVLLLTDRSERKPTLRNVKWALGTFLGRSAKRSEEHTSELQSLAYLVCRLLLEKKKTNRCSHY